jgi:ribonuclease P protein component
MSERAYTFPRTHRLSGRLAFKRVFDGSVREARGPLLVFALPNDRGHPRLGLSVTRRVGIAVKRNTIKRRLRDAIRLLQHDLPRGYDWIIVVRPHDPLSLADYQRLLSGLVTKLHRRWEEKAARETKPPTPI